jgi:hypothetical protein
VAFLQLRNKKKKFEIPILINSIGTSAPANIRKLPKSKLRVELGT